MMGIGGINIYINGNWIEEDDREKIEVLNPATEEVFAELPRGDEDDVDKAVRAAERAFEGWRNKSGEERGSYLDDVVELLETEKDNIARNLTKEQGKSLSEAKGEVSASIRAFRYYARKARNIEGRIPPTESDEVRSFVEKEPVGPVAAISPWNYPVLLLSWKLAPALAAGCTVVGKPATKTPLAVREVFRSLDEAGLPPGVVNLVFGPGSTVGKALVRHDGIRKVAFTGQTGTGRQIMRDASTNIKELTLELGGHCPLIVDSDAKIDDAVEAGVYRSFRNMGQICNSINRIYVQENVYEEFLEEFVERASKLSIANGIEDPDADLGPMLDESGLEKTKRHIEDALDKGAELEYGGEPPQGEEYSKGYFFKPTVLTNVNHDMIVMTEETFGPVAPIMKFAEVQEAVEYSNDSIYGLVAYLFTEDLEKAYDIAEDLEYGTVGVNNVSGGDAPYPYSGWKQSGLGTELSEEGLNEYLKPKHIRAKSLR
ncbi:hypothetical protein AKJ65_02240 [candidate division MSBL1 archaeon SCGC-AAA259E19]|uniref:Aldehyde dehydrogenase domain-containing protein n=2 Tax=candidate division MSBL1 TaxID=215777 RepID=A0A133UYF0_9EURY|nr:hypothetical protein AKJ65_02240 [candidate division MSBL1 archaeon SCGC-AAA259E19]KXA99205.1 hypothetical protein AKJ41_05810 [candidate division MSBL1 archaeon SCGC-AAA259O05]